MTARESAFSDSERAILRALASAALPAGRLFPAAGEETLSRTEAVVASLGPTPAAAWRGMLWVLEAAALPRFAGRFSTLSAPRRLRVLEALGSAEAGRSMLRALLVPLKTAHFDDPAIHAAVGSRYVPERAAPETGRWRAQASDAGELGGDAELECDAVVVGTGAGGAPVAKELAEQGFAVLLLEEGGLLGRADFTGRPVQMVGKLYRHHGGTLAFGNGAIPVPVGRAVGGTTTINNGTCLRAPDAMLASWRDELGLTGLGPAEMTPFFRRVEEVLQVAPSESRYVGKPGELIARGCDALGWPGHGPLPRNAPGCDGQSLCCFGCPTGAKRSTDVSYVPLALDRGAQLLTGVRVDRVLVEGETAVGVEGSARTPEGKPVRVRVRARVVVLACGALHTPALLLAQGLANGSGQLGKNLSVHPASWVIGLFDEPVGSCRSVPQGYAVHQFQGEGMLFEGSATPLEITAASLSGFGPDFVDLMEGFDRMLPFGFLVRDTSRGRVRPGPGGEPLVTYWLDRPDRDRIQRGLGLLFRVLFAAGAREVHTGLVGWDRLGGLADVGAFERARLPARHLDLSAYHPLGTARMGRDPLRSVLDAGMECHDVHNLFVCDGSAMPGSLGVNPQVTIMALATRAAFGIARRLERLWARAAA